MRTREHREPVEAAAAVASDARATIRAIADTCVKCGLCVERCPSYRVLAREQDSPRGRIALAAALASGQLTANNASALAALDRCLNCGTCTRVCPADVDFDRLIDLTRATFARPPSLARKAARGVTQRPAVLRILHPLARLASVGRVLTRRGMAQVPRRTQGATYGSWRAMTENLGAAPHRTPPLPAFTAAQGERRGSIALFRGCVAGVLDADTQHAATQVLARLGFDVHAPTANHCCGALDRHHGLAVESEARATDAQARYAATSASHVLGTASGCHAQLRDRVFGGTALAFDDLFSFLDRDETLPTLVHQPMPMRVALHTPCTQRDVAGVDAALRRVLARIPRLEIASLPDEPACCGAAGTYFADHPDVAGALRAERLAGIEASRASWLLSTNIGCRTHLATGLAGTPVVHPITLLDLALRESTA